MLRTIDRFALSVNHDAPLDDCSLAPSLTDRATVDVQVSTIHCP